MIQIYYKLQLENRKPKTTGNLLEPTGFLYLPVIIIKTKLFDGVHYE